MALCVFFRIPKSHTRSGTPAQLERSGNLAALEIQRLQDCIAPDAKRCLGQTLCFIWVPAHKVVSIAPIHHVVINC